MPAITCFTLGTWDWSRRGSQTSDRHSFDDTCSSVSLSSLHQLSEAAQAKRRAQTLGPTTAASGSLKNHCSCKCDRHVDSRGVGRLKKKLSVKACLPFRCTLAVYSGGDSKCDSAVSNNNHSKDEGSKSPTPSNSALVKQKYHDNSGGGGGGGGWSSMKSAIERLLNSGNSVNRKRRAKIQHLIDDVPAWASLIQKMGSVPSSVIVQSIESSASTGVLVLTNRGLNEVPTQAFDYAQQMRILDLSANHLFRLPSPELAAFSNLKSLFLNQNRLVGLPDCLGALVKLECLSVSYNFLESLPDSIANLKSLREVKLASNRFHNFPEKLSELPNLELLDLSANVIETFDTKSASLSNLMAVDVNLNENFVAHIPEDLAKCPRLSILRLQSNQLSLNSIPESLLSDSKVCHILLEGNKFEVDAIKTLDGYESYVERYFSSREDLFIF